MRVLSSVAPAPAARSTWSDEALARALGEDDEKAFAEIYERYWQPLLRQATRKLGRPEDAEEIVQDLFVTLWNKRRTATIQQLDGYLFAMLKYKAIDSIRAQLVRHRHAATATHRFGTPDHGTEETVAVADLSHALATSVHNLPDSAREVFRLSRQEHQSVPEIAARLQVSPKTVEYHLSRSLRFLRSYLKEFLVSMVVLAQVVG